MTRSFIKTTLLIALLSLAAAAATAPAQDAQPNATPTPAGDGSPSPVSMGVSPTPIPKLDNLEVVAIVNKRFMLREDLDRKIAVELAEETFADEEARQRRTNDAADGIIDRWVDSVLLSEEARQRGLSAATAEIDARIEIFRRENDIDTTEKMTAVLKEQGLTMPEFRQATADLILTEKLINLVAKDYLGRENLRKIYEVKPELFFSPARVHLLHIFKQPEDAYDIKSRRAAKSELEKIRKQARRGADFKELARKHSDGMLAEAGGDLGWVAPINQMPVLLGREKDGHTVGHEGFKLKKPGEVSDVLESKLGYHLIQLVEKRPAQNATFEEAEPAVKNFVLDETANRILLDIKQNKKSRVIINLSGVPDKYLVELGLGE